MVAIAGSQRRVGIATVLLLLGLVLSMFATGRPIVNVSQASAHAPLTADWSCNGTRYFNDHRSVGQTITSGQTIDGGTIVIEGDSFMEMRDNPAGGSDPMHGHIVAEFDRPGVTGNDTATITFDRNIQITSIYLWDNDPAAGETGWSFQGSLLTQTGHQNALIIPWNETTNTVTFSAGLDSGGIDFCYVEVPNGGGTEGCTPGYWKQAHHFDSWVTYVPTQTLESVFDVPDSLGMDNFTLLQALNFGGGGGVEGMARNLLRHAVASLLNGSNPNVDSPLTDAEVISATNTALASLNRGTMETQKNIFEDNNELGCPLN
ncbi:MAG TPA: hypothetical protein VHK28_03930 [Candidatus Limnocylindria bacterium]|nr:hypothetical protein [Candidatus Limnocylindria bacterium]